MGTFHAFDFTLSLNYLWRANPAKEHGEELCYDRDLCAQPEPDWVLGNEKLRAVNVRAGN